MASVFSPKCCAAATLLLVVTLSGAAATRPPAATSTNDVIALIRDEGLNRSQLMETLSYLTEVIGPRLTGSPNHKRANEWTRDKLAGWGLTNAHLEAWGPFGRGWSLEKFSVQVVEPQGIPLIACPKAWSPGLDKPLVGNVVYLDTRNSTDFEQYKGKLKGAIVLASPVREIRPRFEPLATRMTETNLLRLANAGESPSSTFPPGSPRFAAGDRPGPPPESRVAERREAASSTTNAARSGSAPPNRGGPFPRGRSGPRYLSFLAEEGAALVVNASPMGDGGTIFVSAASVPSPESRETNRFANFPRPWSTNLPATLPQIILAGEDYNRLVRMIERGEKLKMAVDFAVRFQGDDLMAYNTIAEIPGTDLKDEIVMVGAHLDSLYAGTGATDDAVGVAAAMEAVRILTALKLQPRRTVRIGLWAGEEQGFLGSRAYVSDHFGYYTNVTSATALRSPKDESDDTPRPRSASDRPRPTRKLIRMHEYEKLSAYFNLDNGAGKIRGIHLQGNDAVRPFFRRWLAPFKDLEAETVSLSNTGGTDHIPFDSIGLPGFQFIQDPLDYNSRTHHSNQDVLDRIVPDDAKQAAVILAAFVWNTAMLDERLPRKSAE